MQTLPHVVPSSSTSNKDSSKIERESNINIEIMQCGPKNSQRYTAYTHFMVRSTLKYTL